MLWVQLLSALCIGINIRSSLIEVGRPANDLLGCTMDKEKVSGRYLSSTLLKTAELI